MSTITFQQKLNTLPKLPRILFLQLLFKLGLTKKVLTKQMPTMTQGITSDKTFQNYQPTEHDVFAATFAKSGTNWSMQICQQIACLGNAEFEHIHHLVAWPDAFILPNPIVNNIVPLNDTSIQEKSPTGLRVIKTHLPSQAIPYSPKATYISIIRDPKEVLVSSFYFMGSVMNFAGQISVADWFEINLLPGSFLSAWANHTASYWLWRDRPNVLVLTFNEMKQDSSKAIARIAEIMGVSLTESQFAQVLERSSFQYMKKHDAKFAPIPLPFLNQKPVVMMRKGKSGASNELLNQTQQAEIDRFCQAELKKLGSDFPYTTLFKVLEQKL